MPRKLSFAWVLFVLSTAAASAQVNGMPASVTSPGFGGRQVNGVAPSVTSLGPRGYTPAIPTCCFRGTSTANPNQTFNFHPHHHNGSSGAWGGAVYSLPYYGYYNSGEEIANDSPDDQYQGGPTVFDRRGPGIAPPQTSARADVVPDPVEPAEDQPQTVLIFKDGHQLEVANYAIVGSTLYDLTGGHHQKIALSDLDLTATAKQNDDRGIDFQLPAAAE